MKWAGYVQGSRAATGPEVSGPFRSGGGVGPDLGLRVGAVGSFLGLARPGQHFLQGNSPTFVGCTGPVYTPHQTRAAQREQGLRDCTPVKIFTGGNAYGIGEQQKGEHCIYNNRMINPIISLPVLVVYSESDYSGILLGNMCVINHIG